MYTYKKSFWGGYRLFYGEAEIGKFKGDEENIREVVCLLRKTDDTVNIMLARDDVQALLSEYLHVIAQVSSQGKPLESSENFGKIAKLISGAGLPEETE